MGSEGNSDAAQGLISELVNALRSQRSSEQVDLPYFRPEVNESSKWVSHVETLKSELSWSDIQTLARIGRFLLNDAKLWFERWNPEIRDWVNFRKDFIDSFPPKRNLGRLFEEAAKFTSLNANTYETYVHEKYAMLNSLRAKWSESDSVELIVHGISELDVRNAAINANCQTISELLIFLSSFVKPLGKEFYKKVTSFPDSKRKYPFFEKHGVKSAKRCYQCGKLGHIKTNCYVKKPRLSSESASSRSNQSESFRQPSSTVTLSQSDTCSFCAKRGHNISNCFMKAAIDKRRSIHFCSTKKPAGATEVFIEGRIGFGLW